jgi:hypothetical protein
LQLAYWPSTSIAAALPAGWSLAEKASERDLLHGVLPEIRIHYSDAEHWHHSLVFENLALGYEIRIDAVPDTGAANTVGP